jgi:hypothetical protein
MYLHFEDWSQFLFRLEERGLLHGSHILKVYANDEDPRSATKYDRVNIAVFEVDDSNLKADEVFTYQNRETYSGKDIEQKLQSIGLSDSATKRVRALFRFSNQPETQFTQAAMKLKSPEGNWLIQHPLEDINGFDLALRDPHQYSDVVHLDIFEPDSLIRAAKLLRTNNLNECNAIVTMDEIINLGRRQYGEGRRTSRHKER